MANVYFKMLKDSIIKKYTDEPIYSLQIELMDFADSISDKTKIIFTNESN